MGILPKALRDRPDPHELGIELDEAFNILSSSRQYSGMGSPMPIAVSEMLLYCWGFEIHQVDERSAFVRTMQRLDAAYLGEVAKRQDSGTKVAVVQSPVPTDNSGTQ